MTELVISEVFGPTLQGEGPSAGRRAAFVRLGRCNLDCSWCDTPFTWDWQGRNGVAYDPKVELHRRAAALVAGEVVAMDTPLVVITGGEPLLQRSGLITLTEMLAACGRQVEIETNGTRPPLYDGDPWARPWLRYNVSPKLANSGIPESKRDPGAAVARFEPQVAAFKFVVGDVDELEEVAAVVGDVVHPSRVWIMPEGRTPVDVVDGIAALAGVVVDRGWNLSSRLHVLAWGDQRGH